MTEVALEGQIEMTVVQEEMIVGLRGVMIGIGLGEMIGIDLEEMIEIVREGMIVIGQGEMTGIEIDEGGRLV